MATAWVLVPSLVSLRDEFNRLAPQRDKASDGSIGDTAHAGSPSDHNPDESGNTPYEDADSVNEVHAIDVDADLRKADWSMAKAVGVIVGRHRSGRDNRLQNVIWNRQIWSDSWGWTARPYTGANPHDHHAHFSSKYATSHETNTRPWGLIEEDERMAKLDSDDVAAIAAAVKNLLTQDATVESLDRARPWQYNGSPLPTGLSAVWTLAQIHAATAATLKLTQQIATSDNVDEQALAAALAPVVGPQVARSVLESIEQQTGEVPFSIEQIEQATQRAMRQVLVKGVGSSGA